MDVPILALICAAFSSHAASELKIATRFKESHIQCWGERYKCNLQYGKEVTYEVTRFFDDGRPAITYKITLQMLKDALESSLSFLSLTPA